VIATGFDKQEEAIPVEVVRETTRRPAQRSNQRELAPQTTRAHMRPEISRDALPVLTSRRSAAAAASLQASAPPLSSTMPAVRDRITFPSNLDTDWDVPAFQRRQNG